MVTTIGVASLVNDSLSLCFCIDVFAFLILLLIFVHIFCVVCLTIKGKVVLLKRDSSSTSKDPSPESQEVEVASPLSPISAVSGFSKASTFSRAEILLERLVSALVESDEECTVHEKTRGEEQKRMEAH